MPCNPDLGPWWISISFWLPSILTSLPGGFEEAETTSYFASFLWKMGHSIAIRFLVHVNEDKQGQQRICHSIPFLEQLYLWCQRPSVMMLVDKLQGLPLSGANRGATLVLYHDFVCGFDHMANRPDSLILSAIL